MTVQRGDVLTSFNDYADSLEQELLNTQSGLAAANEKVSAILRDKADLQDRYDEYVRNHPNVTQYGFWAGQDKLGGTDSAHASFDRVSGYLGAPQVYRMFFSGLPPQNFVGSAADFGPPVVVSFKAPPAEVIAGKHDAYLLAWFASIPSDRKVWWSYWHEPEDDIEKAAFTAAQYRAAWSRLLALAPKRANLRATLILMGFSLFKPSRVISDYVTPGLHVLAWDSYLTGTTKTLANVIDKPKAVSESFGLGFGIGETSVAHNYSLPGMTHEQTVQVLSTAWTTDAKSAEFVCWFETNKSDGDWRIRPFQGAVAAWKGVRNQ